MSNLYLTKALENEKFFYSAHRSEEEFAEQMLNEEIVSAIAYDVKEKTYLTAEPTLNDRGKIWVKPGGPLKDKEMDLNGEGEFVLIKTTEEGETYIYLAKTMEDFKALYLNECEIEGAISSLAFINLEKYEIQNLEITFKGFEFEITPVK